MKALQRLAFLTLTAALAAAPLRAAEFEAPRPSPSAIVTAAPLAGPLGRAALLSEAEETDPGVRGARSSAPRLRLAKAGERFSPKRPSPRAPVEREHPKSNPVARALRLAAFSGSMLALFRGAPP